ncbi:VOC family protein [Erwinia sp. 9145]|uniref:VOC family protein n=1 Tax=Erwinia sp. 9145 TaxID=1500895 RepID=UPI00055020E0|nr:VOC family protein [Erwinia sp. 9145]
MPEPIPELDHVVINVAGRLDEAETRFRRLGFQLTARGHHSLGSSNHLAVFGENYLELLGYGSGAGEQRSAIWTSPPGLNGLVWKTQDADAVWQRLRQQDLAGEAPQRFFRPVILPDGHQQEARFCTVRLKPESVPNGRSFFCQHLTPEAVWQTAWQHHPNGVINIRDFVIASEAPAQAASVYQRLFPSATLHAENGSLRLRAGRSVVSFLTPDAVLNQYGSLPDGFDGSPRMAALGLTTSSLEQARERLIDGEIPFTEGDNALLVGAENAFNLALRFHAA